MSEAVKVVVRCRPMNQREKDMNCTNVVSMDPATCTCHLTNPAEPAAPCKSFRFDGVYGENSSTENIYNEVAYPLIEGVPEGYNCTVFAYGQTGCGKSFTMQGPRISAPQHRGIVPRALEQLFEAAAVSDGAKFLLAASFLEIHNEEIRDLLSPNRQAKLELREHPEKGVYVHELSSHAVHSLEQCLELMERGWASRSVGATLMNADSSRSHCIFSVNVERMEMRGMQECSKATIRRGKLNLVDLAGSERQTKTGASGERLKEATKINLSLSALGNVISALVDGKTKHIPYRDSKLTRLLQDSLGGNTKTLMVACLSPADYNYDETLSTLRYAHRAKSIENSPRVNEDPKDAMLRQYQQEIEQLRMMLRNSTNADLNLEKIDTGGDAGVELQARYESQVANLKAQCEAEQRSKEQLRMDLEALRSEYHNQLETLNHDRKVDAVANTSPSLDRDVKMISPMKEDTGVNCQEEISLSASQREVLARLRSLQASMVGGELAHDTELKERRQSHRKASERRLKALASALGRKDDEDAAVLQVYDDIEQELAAKSDALRRARIKLRAHEREIKDLQHEFEEERTDYLETIRKQDRLLKLFQQICTKMVPLVKPECNYSDLERIKTDAVWNDDTQKWKLPEVVIGRTKFPPAAPVHGGGSGGHASPPRGLIQPGGRAPSRTAPARMGSQPSSPEHHVSRSDSPQDTLMQKLERSEQENLAGNYFKPKRATELLIKAQEEAGIKASQTWKEAILARNGRVGVGSGGGPGNQVLNTSLGSSSGASSSNSSTSGSGQGSPLQQAISLANHSLHGAINNNNNIINNSIINPWAAQNFGVRTTVQAYSHLPNGNSDHMRSPDFLPIRKPTRLEALPILDKMGTRKRAKAELNTMDIL